jgi:hypothetical protein
MGRIEVKTKGVTCCEFYRPTSKPADSNLWALQISKNTDIPTRIAGLTPNTRRDLGVVFRRAVTKVESKYVHPSGN